MDCHPLAHGHLDACGQPPLDCDFTTKNTNRTNLVSKVRSDPFNTEEQNKGRQSTVAVYEGSHNAADPRDESHGEKYHGVNQRDIGRD